MQGPNHNTPAAGAPGRSDDFGIIGHKGRQLVQTAKGLRPGEKGDQLRGFIGGEIGYRLDHTIGVGRRAGVDIFEYSPELIRGIAIMLALCPARDAGGNILHNGFGLGLVKSHPEGTTGATELFR